ncbi:MAG: nicotinate-nucleotide adenylyltransferase [Planctomycetota bacterium]
MRIGIFGGTFDPVHYGHLLLAERCRELLSLDEVRLVPAGDPYHKDRDDVTPAKARAEMLEFATAGNPRFVVDRREIKRSGPSYTIDTLRELRSERPDDELYLLMGADSLADLPNWREPEEILELAVVVAVTRPGEEISQPDELAELWGGRSADRIRVVGLPLIELSSSDLRQRVCSGRSVRYMTPAAVTAYIEAQGLYEPAE